MLDTQMNRRSLFRNALRIGPAALLGLDALFTAERTNAAAVGPERQDQSHQDRDASS